MKDKGIADQGPVPPPVPGAGNAVKTPNGWLLAISTYNTKTIPFAFALYPFSLFLPAPEFEDEDG